MNSSRECHCTLCKLEASLLQDISAYPPEEYESFRRLGSHLSSYPTPNLLVEGLRIAGANADSDSIFRQLRDAAGLDQPLVNEFLVLAFLPMMHGVTTQIASHNPALAREDISQQTLEELFRFLRSREFQSRNSYIAYSVSRAVKRQSFRWAVRQRRHLGWDTVTAEICLALMMDEPFERLTVLRHFLSRNLAKGVLDVDDLDLLIQLKLGGNTGGDLAEEKGISSNAVRQRAKRLLAKLRGLANRNGRHPQRY